MLLAVSGGPDSTALLAACAATRAEAPVHAATVDHGLRPDSAAEARAVAALCGELGVPHQTLAWTGPKPAHGLQAAARAARYDLLARHAATIGADLLLTGHTRDDQAETVLMRLLAGSGPAGLAGMRRERALGPLRLARPFLDIPKTDLVAYCAARGLAFARDPTNHDARFARARLRALLPALAGEGLSPERLCRLAARCARDAAALEQGAGDVLAAACQEAPDGSRLVLDGERLRGLPEAVLLRVVGLGLARLDPDGPERLERLERLVLEGVLPALRTGRPLRRTLRAVLVEVTREGDLALSPAPPRRGERTRGP
ncbi:tRNA lysidine(34) synthetase TilS [Methylobacterium sp. J-078]|uniref:tRNA lysidine(34) synthetase TilS n=1 Tax=Methylobacterium sp. J-078 TaxID=2836657 RepID=UPI001FBB7628|nr:tRNA lysidine(34) synthetase TilS [Methylobacterium sp. J-078]MCJ2047485.1 tRNA lysidine(34) synthetase TilS [Methylobacterium sp. J-078]